MTTNNKEEILKFLDEAFTSYEREMIDLYAKNVAIEFALYLKEKEMLPQYDKEPIWQKRDGWKRYTTEQLYSLWEQTKSSLK